MMSTGRWEVSTRQRSPTTMLRTGCACRSHLRGSPPETKPPTHGRRWRTLGCLVNREEGSDQAVACDHRCHHDGGDDQYVASFTRSLHRHVVRIGALVGGHSPRPLVLCLSLSLERMRCKGCDALVGDRNEQASGVGDDPLMIRLLAVGREGDNRSAASPDEQVVVNPHEVRRLVQVLRHVRHRVLRVEEERVREVL